MSGRLTVRLSYRNQELFLHPNEAHVNGIFSILTDKNEKKKKRPECRCNLLNTGSLVRKTTFGQGGVSESFLFAYKANAAKKSAAMMLPEMEVRTPELVVSSWVGVAEANGLAVELLLMGGATRRVVGMAVGFAAGAVVEAGTAAGAVAWMRPVEEETVMNSTAGRVTAVETTMTAELEGITVPALMPVDCVTA